MGISEGIQKENHQTEEVEELVEEGHSGILERTWQWKIENISELHSKHKNHRGGKQEWKRAEGNKSPAHKSLMFKIPNLAT